MTHIIQVEHQRTLPIDIVPHHLVMAVSNARHLSVVINYSDNTQLTRRENVRLQYRAAITSVRVSVQHDVLRDGPSIFQTGQSVCNWGSVLLQVMHYVCEYT